MQPSVLPPPPSGGDGGDKGRKMCSHGHANHNHQHQASAQSRPPAQSAHHHPPRPPGGKGVMNGGLPSPHPSQGGPSQGGCEAGAGPHASSVGNGHCSACLVTGSGRQSNGEAETGKVRLPLLRSMVAYGIFSVSPQVIDRHSWCVICRGLERLRRFLSNRVFRPWW